MANLLVVIHPFTFTKIDLFELGPRLGANALPDPLQQESSDRCQSTDPHTCHRSGRQTVGSKSTNSKFLQSRVTNGANCPLSAEYSLVGKEGSNLALPSRLQRPHFHTKLAMPPLPPATSYSS